MIRKRSTLSLSNPKSPKLGVNAINLDRIFLPNRKMNFTPRKFYCGPDNFLCARDNWGRDISWQILEQKKGTNGIFSRRGKRQKWSILILCLLDFMVFWQLLEAKDANLKYC